MWNQFTIQIHGEGQRDALKEFLAAKEIGSDIYYPLTLDQQECFARLDRSGPPLVQAARIASECLSLPVYPELKEEQIQHVIEAIGEWLA